MFDIQNILQNIHKRCIIMQYRRRRGLFCYFTGKRKWYKLEQVTLLIGRKDVQQ